jgi:hypothetical protein
VTKQRPTPSNGANTFQGRRPDDRRRHIRKSQKGIMIDEPQGEQSSTHQRCDDVTKVPVRAAQRIVDVLTALGVPFVFGVPGAKIDAVFDALSDGGPELVVCRHEQNAVFMAAEVGRLTGLPGVVLVTSGPGTANLATGLLTANTEQDPVVALCGAIARADRLKRTHQSMNAAAMLSTVTKFTAEVDDLDNTTEAVIGAFRAASTELRGAAAVVLPSDVLAASTRAFIGHAAPVPILGAATPDIDHRSRRTDPACAPPGHPRGYPRSRRNQLRRCDHSSPAPNFRSWRPSRPPG